MIRLAVRESEYDFQEVTARGNWDWWDWRMAEMSAKSVLAVYPDVIRYSAADDEKPGESQLLEKLKSQHDTQPVGIFDEEDVLLDDLGLVQGTYRMTTTALSQLCSVLAPGLAPLLQNLSGMKKRKDRYSGEQYSVKRAIGLLNYMLEARFDILRSRYRFIMDRRNRVIEGVVGPKYYFMANLDLYNRVQKFFREIGPIPPFLEGALSGRRLQLRYKNVKRCFALRNPLGKMEPFYSGWHFSNSELGDCCIKGSAILFRSWSGSTSIHPYGKSTKLVHLQGRNFDDKVQAIFRRIEGRVAAIPEMHSRLQSLMDMPLGLGGRRDAHESRCDALAICLTKGGLRRQLADDVVAYVVTQGSYRAGRISLMPDAGAREIISPEALQMAAGRSGYDMYNALCMVARRFQPEKQESIEQSAFQILNGKLNFSDKE